jgi:hypothetical protein
MQKLAVICVILALMNSFIGQNYIAGYNVSSHQRPLLKDAYTNSVLPIDSFVIPLEGTQCIVQHPLRTSASLPFLTLPQFTYTQLGLTKNIAGIIPKSDYVSSLGMIKVSILRL